MNDVHKQCELNERLLAMADGELSPEECRELCDRLAADPQLEARLAYQRQLKEACTRAMVAPECCCPDALRERVRKLCCESLGQGDRRERPAVIGYIGRWLPAAVAAVLFVTALVLFLDRGQSVDPTTGDSQIAGSFASLTLPENSVRGFKSRHADCGRDTSAIYRPESFPREVAALPGALSDYFHQSVATGGLDLSRIGYEYQVTGLCSAPGQGAVHVLYKALPGTGRDDALSLWLRPYDGQTAVDPGKLYLAKEGDAAMPMLIWREGDMVYYLMGDQMSKVEQAASALHAPATTSPDQGA